MKFILLVLQSNVICESSYKQCFIERLGLMAIMLSLVIFMLFKIELVNG